MSYHDLNATFRPIDRWPGEETRVRKASPFSAPWSSTLELLKTELRHLLAKNVICQVALSDRDIRLDGYPRANARASHPGVILAFDSMHGPLKYACDRFPTWEDNVRAIALGLEALRRVERYGITKRGEQYTGWKALPASSAEPVMTVEIAARFVAEHGRRPHESLLDVAGGLLFDVDEMVNTYRRAARLLHPDAPGGSHAAFVRLQEAKRVLDQHHARGSHG